MANPPPRQSMHRFSRPSPKFRQTRYVEPGPGLRVFFVAAVIAAICGLAVRLHFSPDRVKKIVLQAVAGQKFALGFDRAELKLSRGAIPLFAIQLSQVELMPDASCQVEPALKIAEVLVPFRFFELLAGHVSVGTVSGADLTVDLDMIKRRCDGGGTAPALVPLAPPELKPHAEASAAKAVAETLRWWAPEQLAAADDVISGVQFSRVELVFENGKKRVFLEDFSASIDAGEGVIEISTDLRIPPEVSFGETLPPLSIEATVATDSAGVRVEAPLSEGNLELLATFHPLPENALEIDAHVDVSNAPLSTLVPLLVKSGIATERFKPHFLWLNCSAAIKGRFQGLFAKNPLALSNCAVEGGGSKVQIASALRHPDGSWDPLTINLSGLDLKRALETFSVEGPKGIASDFGRVTGQLDIRNREEGSFKGLVEGAALRFSKRNVRSVQKIDRFEVTGRLHDGRFTAAIDKVAIDGGRFDGEVSFEADRELDRGELHAKVRELAFNPRVQDLLVEGEIGQISGSVVGRFSQRELRTVNAEWSVEHILGRDMRAKDLSLKLDFDGKGIDVALRAPEVQFARASSFFKASRPIFFSHEFAEEWVPVRETSIQAFIPPEGGIQWERLQGMLEGGRVRVSSGGSLSREREMSGWVSVDYPSVKRLKWTLGGTFPNFSLSPESKSLADLMRRSHIDDVTLGLPLAAVADEKDESTTTQALRALGERVIQKAKRIVPGSHAAPAVPAAPGPIAPVSNQ